MRDNRELGEGSPKINDRVCVYMNNSSAIREKMYKAYLALFEAAGRKRRWNIFDDVPWGRISFVAQHRTQGHAD